MEPQTRAVAATLTVRGAGLGVSLLVNILLARALGASGAGMYFLFITWTTLVGTVVAFGLPMFALRSVAQLHHRRSLRTARRLVLRSAATILGFGVVVLLVAIPHSLGLSRLLFRAPTFELLIRLAIASGILMASLRLFVESLKGRGRSSVGLTLEFSVIPSLLLLWMAGVWVIGRDLHVRMVLWGYTVAAFAAVLMAASMFLYGSATGAREEVGLDTGSLMRFWVVDLLTISLYFLPFVALPYFATASEVGQFGVAFRLVALGMITLSTLASLFAPKFAMEHACDDGPALRKSLRASQNYALAAYIPLLGLFLLLGKQILSVFGAEFRSAWILLVLMGCGQLVNSATGLAQYLLYMTGKEAWDLQAQAVTLVVSAALTVLLGHLWGVVGIAAAYSASVVVRSGLTFGLATRRLDSIDSH